MKSTKIEKVGECQVPADAGHEKERGGCPTWSTNRRPSQPRTTTLQGKELKTHLNNFSCGMNDRL
jgi:hypothetical protein